MCERGTPSTNETVEAPLQEIENVRYDNLIPFFPTQGSEVQILSPRPILSDIFRFRHLQPKPSRRFELGIGD